MGSGTKSSVVNNALKNKFNHMKFYIIFFATFFSLPVLSQEKWYKNSQIDFVSINKMVYFYNKSDNSINDEIIEPKGFLVKSYGIQFDYNYLLLKRLSIGAVSGFEFQKDPNFSMFKVGAVIRYFLVDDDNAYLFIQDSNNFSLIKEKFTNGNNFRLGLGIPLLKSSDININGNLYFQQNYFKLNRSFKIIGYSDEIARELTVKSYGISFGIKF